MRQLKISYGAFKTVRGNLPIYYIFFPTEKRYGLYSIATDLIYLSVLTDATEIADFEANYKSTATAVASKRDAEAYASIQSKQNIVVPRANDGKDIVTLWPTQGSKITFITPNWCDKTTWYYRAERVVDEAATVDTPYTIYRLANTYVIDTCHGKISGEDYLKDANNNSYRVIVKVNGITKTETDPHTGSGDYSIDYAQGKITFTSALTSNDIVLVTYHYATNSEFIISPAQGKVLQIRKLEVQFSQDIELTDSVFFQPYGPVEIWAPQLVDNPYPAGTMLPLGEPDVMKTMMDYINDANGAFPSLPPLGGNGWRGTQIPVHVFQWDYQAVTDLSSAKGVQIKLYLEHDIPFGGTVATATMYCLSEDEQVSQ